MRPNSHSQHQDLIARKFKLAWCYNQESFPWLNPVLESKRLLVEVAQGFSERQRARNKVQYVRTISNRHLHIDRLLRLIANQIKIFIPEVINVFDGAFELNFGELVWLPVELLL